MNRGRGGNRGGGAGGGRSYTSRGRSPRSEYQYVARRAPVGAGDCSADASSGIESLSGGRRNSDIVSIDGVTKKFDGLLSSDIPHGPNAEEKMKSLNGPSASSCSDEDFPSLSTPSKLNTRSTKIIPSQEQGIENCNQPYFSCTPLVDMAHKEKEFSQGTGSQFHQEVQSGKTGSEGTTGKDEHDNSDLQLKGFAFDICEERNRSIPKLKPSLHSKNRAIRNEIKRRMQGDNLKIFRPGMILLKGYISLADQVKLVKSCRDLGRGPGGFYQPGYRDGAKLHLRMMCLGKNWDPETCTYGDIRLVDQTKPPPIPNEFQQLVKEVIQECHGFLESDSKVRNARNYLPSMSPNICIVNFYTRMGKLGLHQDKDESQESLRKGLPVVSISLGDSAEFLFGDQRDIDKADKVVLESGDVLVFGGESRHIFHGVSSITPDSAPKALLEETNLKPGRLNLTFREY